MENALNIILSTENVRTLAILVSVLGGVVWLKMSIKSVEHKMELSIKDLKLNDLASIHKRIDEVEISLGKRIDEVEYKVEALSTRLDGSIKALTFTLEKNGSISKEDKEYVDTRLAL